MRTDTLTLTETLVVVLEVTTEEVVIRTNPTCRHPANENVRSLQPTDVLGRVNITTTVAGALVDAARQAGEELAYRLVRNYDG